MDLQAALRQAIRYLAPDLCACPCPRPLEVPLRVGKHLRGTIVGVGDDDAIGHMLQPPRSQGTRSGPVGQRVGEQSGQQPQQRNVTLRKVAWQQRVHGEQPERPRAGDDGH